MPYEIVFYEEAEDHIAGLTARERSLIVDAIERQLLHEPRSITRNRKPMDPDRRFYVAPWELRVGDLRVYYGVEDEPKPTVLIVAIGKKVRDRVRIGGKDVEP
jgi:mRNA-degrading endonuclease RelE of RelBE toxin-antitoxin system